MKRKWLFRISYLYLFIPFVLFCLGWLRLTIDIPVVAISIWVLVRLFRSVQESTEEYPPRSVLYVLILTGLWVLLSGVGGYTFQNWDHNWRNAVLRDLISYHWPVYYSAPDKGPIKMLVYYVGYWLPSALVGKLLGWKFANLMLFLWTWLGVSLVVLHLHLRLKTSLLKIALLLIFFSGMDALGSILFVKEYPTLWPPIQHLEVWSEILQYSSFTTQLFWVFNQAVPAWLCCALIIESRGSPVDKQQEQTPALQISDKVLAWSLCFFFAPLASIGLLPYLAIEWFKQVDFKMPFKNLRFEILLVSGIIALFSYLFFSSNPAAQERGFQSLVIQDLLAFILLEGGILWLLLAPFKWRNPYWIVTGLLLLIFPFIQFGNGRDFVMRASIAPLFCLMVMTAEVIFQNTTSRFYQISFAVLLIVGALTPLYEINRSVYRSVEYYFIIDESQRVQPLSGMVTHLAQSGAPEGEHPGSLTADGIPTLKFMTDELSKNYIANVRQSFFYQYLASH